MTKSRLLKVTSILMLIFGVFGLVIDGFELAHSQLDFGFLTSILFSSTCVVAGLFGILAKSKKSILVLGLLLTLVVIVDALTATVIDVFSFALLIWPLMYLWGWYRSK